MKRLIKKSEYVYCNDCGFDNGDFMYSDNELMEWVPNKNTKKFKQLEKNQVYKSREIYDKENPEDICPKCGKTLSID